MKVLSQRVRCAARAFAWQAVGFTVVFTLLAVGFYRVETTAQDVEGLRPQVTRIIESVEVCQAGASKAQLRTCVRRIEVALRRCRQKPSCRAEFRAVLAPRGGGASQPSSTEGQQPGPRGGGDIERGGEGTPAPAKVPPKSRRPHPQADPPTETDSPAQPNALSVLDQSPSPSPGKAGETPGAEKGLKVCVELDLSACIAANR